MFLTFLNSSWLMSFSKSFDNLLSRHKKKISPKMSRNTHRKDIYTRELSTIKVCDVVVVHGVPASRHPFSFYIIET